VFKKLMAEMRRHGMYLYILAIRDSSKAARRRSTLRKIGRSRGEVVDTIERFVNGICSRWDWDDFCSAPIIDLELDGIRLRCAGLPKEYPSTEKRHYCSEAGIEIMRQIVRQLRQARTSG
jgi:hypothetical protein